MDNINNFYIKMLKAFDLDVVGDIVLSNGDPILVKSKTLILYGETGRQLLQDSPNKYHVFNPMDEDRIGGVNPELKKLLDIYQVRLNLAIKHSALAIMSSLHNAPPLALVPLMDELDKAKGNAKTLADDKLIGHLIELCNDNELNSIVIKIKHGVMVDGEKENSATVVHTPMTKLLEDESFMPSLRKKDRRVFTAMFEWLTTYISSTDRVVAHSHNDDMPDLIAFYKTLINISNKMKPIAKFTKESGSYYDLVENDLDVSDISNLDKLFLDAKLIPSSGVSVVSAPEAKDDDNGVRVISTPEELFGSATAFTQPAQPAYQQPMYQQPMQPTYGQPIQPMAQQPMYQQPMQPPMYQQPYDQPMAQPAYQQPAYQQPMYQQPMQPGYGQPMPQSRSLHDQIAAGDSLFNALKR